MKSNKIISFPSVFAFSSGQLNSPNKRKMFLVVEPYVKNSHQEKGKVK